MIRVKSAPCRTLRDQHGEPVDEEYDPHFDSPEEAEVARAAEQTRAIEHFGDLQRYAADYPGSGVPVLRTFKVIEFDAVCAVLVCDACGDLFEFDGCTWHLPPEAIEGVAVDCEWETVDGKHYCGWRCSPPVRDDDEGDVGDVVLEASRG